MLPIFDIALRVLCLGISMSLDRRSVQYVSRLVAPLEESSRWAVGLLTSDPTCRPSGCGGRGNEIVRKRLPGPPGPKAAE